MTYTHIIPSLEYVRIVLLTIKIYQIIIKYLLFNDIKVVRSLCGGILTVLR